MRVRACYSKSFLRRLSSEERFADHVRQQQVDWVGMGASKLECGLRIACGEDRIAQSSQHVLDQRADFWFVVDDYDGFFRGRHEVNLVQRSIALGWTKLILEKRYVG